MRWIFVILFVVGCKAQATFLISDYDFTNQNWNREKVLAFLNEFESCQLHIAQKVYLSDMCAKYQIHPLVVLTTMQKEMSLIGNKIYINYKFRERWAMGYGIHIKRKSKLTNKKHYWPYMGYEKQILNSICYLRKVFMIFKYGDIVETIKKGKYVKPKNAASYALYCYTPFYGTINFRGKKITGNKNFKIIYQKYRKIWDKL